MSDSPVTSLFGDIKAQRQAIADKLVLRLRIPDWEPHMVALYRIIDTTELETIQKKADKIKSNSVATLQIAMDVINLACIKVLAVVDGEDTAIRSDGEETKFDRDLAEALGLDDPTSRGVIRFLFQVDGDILNTFNAILEHSRLGKMDLEDEYKGE